MSAALVPILLVDDQQENLLAIESQLDDMAELEIIQATSGEEALRLLAAREFALVLLDVQMPGMDGFEVATLMRANPGTCQVPIIFVTGSSAADFEFRGYENGAVDYLVKPIEPFMVRAKVRVFANLYRQRHAVIEHQRYMAHVEEMVATRTGYQQMGDDQLRVLLVDDRRENLIALEALLAEMDDLMLVRANSGQEALRAVLREDFALIMLDVQMPGMDGFETAELIHANQKMAQIPIIFVTAGLKDHESQVRGHEHGVDYLIKPLEPAIVRSKVRVFCDLYRQRITIQKQNAFLEILTADRTTELRRATADLSESLERYRHLAETQDLAARAAGLGFWDWDIGTNRQMWSARMYEIYGVVQGSDGRTYEDWLTNIHPDDRVICDAAVQSALRGEQNYDIEFRIQLANGSLRYIKGDAMVTFDAQGKPQRMTGINYDITERKRTEEELRQLTERLEARVEEKTEQLSQAMTQIFESEKLASLGGIVAGVSHELNTPIGNIVMTASTLQDKHDHLYRNLQEGKLTRTLLGETINECRSASGMLLRNAIRANELIESFKKVAVDQTSERRRVFDLRGTVIDIFNTMGAMMRHAKVNAEVLIPSGIEMDSFPGDLEQILSNLILNSIHHGFESRGSGHIVIDAKEQLGSVEIVYQDDGIGIAPELHRKIFEPFFTTKLGRGGSGLGMFTIHNLVHGPLQGHIQLESVVGRGVRFTLVMPIVTPPAKKKVD
jgi:PAS domain S-box-containing protein